MIRRLAAVVARRLRAAAPAPARDGADPTKGAGRGRVDALADKLRAARERASAEHAAHRTTLGLLRHYLLRLERMETEVAGRFALERRVKRAQLAVAARAAGRRGVTEASAERAARLAGVSCDYEKAVARWRAGDVPAGVRRMTFSGMRWATMPGDPRESSWGKHDAERWLPLEDLGIVRQFAVGGVMLDVAAGVGAAAIPRVLLGDFTRAYAAEPDPERYLCLVGNTLDNHLDGRVLPERADPGGGITLDDWLRRHGVAADDVRFVRVALQPWNRNIFDGAAALLKRRHLVWQLEIPVSELGPEGHGLEPLARAVAAHFTNIKELGRLWADPWVPASRIGDVLRALAGERRAANLLLFNLPGADARKTDGIVISLLHPTARLPEGWKPAMQAFLAKARHPEHVEYILAVNEGEAFSLPEEALSAWGRCALVQTGVTGPNSGFNAAARVSRGQILMTIADDYFPPDGWDEQIRAAIPDMTQEVVLDVDNSDGVDRLLAFSILTRPYYERYGYVLYPGYHGFFGDNEFTEQARRDRVIRKARHIVFEHRHPDRGTSPMDEVYTRQRSCLDEGRQLFRERKAKGFPKWPQ